MIRIVDVAASRARMVIAFIALSLLAGGMAYVGLGSKQGMLIALFSLIPPVLVLLVLQRSFVRGPSGSLRSPPMSDHLLAPVKIGTMTLRR